MNTNSIDKYKAINGVVLRIPVGTVASYGQVAALAGLPGRARLVGKALSSRINEMDIPWYRVLRSDGKIAFAESSIQYQRQVEQLKHDGVVVIKGKVNMRTYQWESVL
ncbi:MGMT family protein [Alteromonas sp. 5E99-2]|uniref:MGMT family protein n=1 Tax=Alteromonas sp. 5E99-2 TaxID=2817683 RepID=UPI001A981606|nr:MGMT family protein [Alteromonas sp. 5E99-2]MBO1254438.1 MGMT family protein [Alteromonas sp. 5E99-2]